ncbi:hypothetical protein NHX12_017251, partial [Muraenolepis orangiensis]
MLERAGSSPLLETLPESLSPVSFPPLPVRPRQAGSQLPCGSVGGQDPISGNREQPLAPTYSPAFVGIKTPEDMATSACPKPLQSLTLTVPVQVLSAWDLDKPYQTALAGLERREERREPITSPTAGKVTFYSNVALPCSNSIAASSPAPLSPGPQQPGT